VQIILTSVVESLALAWEEYCSDLPDVTVYRGSILDVPATLSSKLATSPFPISSPPHHARPD
jgi:hypothetical protein